MVSIAATAHPSTTPSPESRALDLLVNAETFLHDCKSTLEHCPGYATLQSQLELWVPSFRSFVAKAAVDGFRIQRTIDLLRTLHTFLLDDTTRRNIYRSGVGAKEWARLVLPITDVLAALKSILHRPPSAEVITPTHL